MNDFVCFFCFKKEYKQPSRKIDQTSLPSQIISVRTAHFPPGGFFKIKKALSVERAFSVL